MKPPGTIRTRLDYGSFLLIMKEANRTLTFLLPSLISFSSNINLGIYYLLFYKGMLSTEIGR